MNTIISAATAILVILTFIVPLILIIRKFAPLTSIRIVCCAILSVLWAAVAFAAKAFIVMPSAQKPLLARIVPSVVFALICGVLFVILSAIISRPADKKASWEQLSAFSFAFAVSEIFFACGIPFIFKLIASFSAEAVGENEALHAVMDLLAFSVCELMMAFVLFSAFLLVVYSVRSGTAAYRVFAFLLVSVTLAATAFLRPSGEIYALAPGLVAFLIAVRISRIMPERFGMQEIMSYIK